MGKIKNTIQKAKEVQEKMKELKASKGIEEIKKLSDTFLGKEKKETKKQSNIAKEYVGSELEELEDKVEAHEEKERSRGFLGTVVTGALGLLGYKALSGDKEKIDNAVEAGAKVVDLATDTSVEGERKKKEINDAAIKGLDVYDEVKELEDETQERFKLKKKPEIKAEEKFKEMLRKTKKYGSKDYGNKEAWGDAWTDAEFEYDEEGNIENERRFFSRIFAAIALFFRNKKRSATLRPIHERLVASGGENVFEHMEEKEAEIKADIEQAKKDIKKAKKSKKEVAKSFRESPGILWSSKEIFRLSKTYKQELRELAKTAGSKKMTKKEIETGLRRIVNKYRKMGWKKGGKAFLNNAKLKEAFPGMKVSQTALKSRSILKGNVAFRFIEISGKALAAFLRTGRHEGIAGGWQSAKDVFTDADTWKDACPIWGSIRSIQKLNIEDGRSGWSKALEIGFSVGMDIAMIVSIVGSFGTATAGVAGLRTAGMASIKGLTRKQILRQAEEMTSKESIKFFRKNAIKMAGGKWMVGFNLVATVAEGLFSDEEIHSVGENLKKSLLTNAVGEEGMRSIEITKNSDDEEYVRAEMKRMAEEEPIYLRNQQEGMAAAEYEKRKRELEKKDKLFEAGLVSEAYQDEQIVAEPGSAEEENDESLFDKTIKKIIPAEDKKKEAGAEKDNSARKESAIEKAKKNA